MRTCGEIENQVLGLHTTLSTLRHLEMNILTPKQSGEFISKFAKNVFILPDGIKKLANEVAEGIKNKQICIDGFSQHELHPQKADESSVDWIFFVDTLNFCFWSANENTKWEVIWNGKTHTGYFALCASVRRALQDGIPVTDPKFYSQVTSAELDHILRSDNPNAKVPLLEDRVTCLHQVGKILMEKYMGSFVMCLKECNNSAQNLLQLIVQEFPCFRDEADFQGHRVAIYKRAQILIGDIWACFRGEGLGHFSDIDTITMFADYRVPQVLVHYGVLKYSDELMELLKSDKLLENGSENEVEIRGCSIQAVDLVADEARKLLKSQGHSDLIVSSILIDHFLWDYRRKHAAMLELIPFHKTMSIFY
ncbi:queuosine salvage protein isoform X2 [Cryptotermes secundus]|uniref:queuosine salvage protein isoform X2 n=1 Tax=Cryptotermes secundus TaxID=105785 RepID=UPI000CD7B2B5|nr:queuosine salvage protein isoform X2 [Cryptotermes secundus]